MLTPWSHHADLPRIPLRRHSNQGKPETRILRHCSKVVLADDVPERLMYSHTHGVRFIKSIQCNQLSLMNVQMSQSVSSKLVQ
jgi:hypothetical protein